MGVYFYVMKRLMVFPLLFALMPTLVMAAGFAKDPIFLSKNPVIAGDTILIHAVVSNQTTSKFSGQLIFTDNGVSVGTTSVSLAAGAANAASMPWKPTAGEHTIVAELHSANGDTLEQNSATFKVLEPSVQVPALTEPTNPLLNTPTGVESSKQIQNMIAGFAPSAGHVLAPVFSSIDSGRSLVTQQLDHGIDWSKQQLAQTGKNAKLIATPNKPAGVASTTPSGIWNTLWTILSTLGLYLFSILRYLVVNAGVFYPLFLILFLYGMWKLFKRMRRSY